MSMSKALMTVTLLAGAGVAAGQAPVFLTTLDDAASITSSGGALAGSAPNFVAGMIGNAFQSSGNSYARWNNAAVQTIFGSWNNGAGITVDY